LSASGLECVGRKKKWEPILLKKDGVNTLEGKGGRNRDFTK